MPACFSEIALSMKILTYDFFNEKIATFVIVYYGFWIVFT